MQHFASLQDVNIQDAWLTIGSFDGVHLGHQKILEKLTAGAQMYGAPAVVLTFNPHPSAILRGQKESFYLTTAKEKANFLEAANVDILITQQFNRAVASIPAREFVETLKTHLGFTQLYAGQDFALGHNREGDITALREFGGSMNFEVAVIEPMRIEGEVVSSSLIRQLLLDGKIGDANSMLGRAFTLEGEVVQGEGRGKSIGVPTANLAIRKERAAPGSGVYVCRAEVKGRSWKGVANIGVRPTFEQNAAARVEVHLLDFDEDIYGETVRVQFIIRLRGERKFEGVAELVAQIRVDIEQAKKILAELEAEA